MTTIALTKTPSGNTRTMIVNWLNLANGDDGEPIPFSQYADKSAQVIGTFGVGGSITLEGSNNGTDWAPLTDPQGSNLVFTTAKIEMVTEATLLVRPRVSAGDGTTSLSMILLMKE
jgi:hypothetical protein